MEQNGLAFLGYLIFVPESKSMRIRRVLKFNKLLPQMSRGQSMIFFFYALKTAEKGRGGLD